MAGKIAKVLKVAAGSAALAGVYMAGCQMGKSEVAQEVPAAPVSVPRPGMRSMSDIAVRAGHASKSYHDSINECANDLRARIAAQVGEGIGPVNQGSSDGQRARVVEARDAQVVSAPSVIEPLADDLGQDDPYKRIHDAITSSELFDESGDKAYKPTPFTMPGK